MKKCHSNLSLRVEFEPNRFSADFLLEVYEKLKPVEVRILSDEHKNNGEPGIIVAIEGGKK